MPPPDSTAASCSWSPATMTLAPLPGGVADDVGRSGMRHHRGLVDQQQRARPDGRGCRARPAGRAGGRGTPSCSRPRSHAGGGEHVAGGLRGRDADDRADARVASRRGLPRRATRVLPLPAGPVSTTAVARRRSARGRARRAWSRRRPGCGCAAPQLLRAVAQRRVERGRVGAEQARRPGARSGAGRRGVLGVGRSVLPWLSWTRVAYRVVPGPGVDAAAVQVRGAGTAAAAAIAARPGTPPAPTDPASACVGQPVQQRDGRVRAAWTASGRQDEAEVLDQVGAGPGRVRGLRLSASARWTARSEVAPRRLAARVAPAACTRASRGVRVAARVASRVFAARAQARTRAARSTRARRRAARPTGAVSASQSMTPGSLPCRGGQRDRLPDVQQLAAVRRPPVLRRPRRDRRRHLPGDRDRPRRVGIHLLLGDPGDLVARPVRARNPRHAELARQPALGMRGHDRLHRAEHLPQAHRVQRPPFPVPGGLDHAGDLVMDVILRIAVPAGPLQPRRDRPAALPRTGPAPRRRPWCRGSQCG